MALKKSDSEQKADTLLRVMQRGRASLREVAILIDKSWPTVKAHVELGQIATIQLGTRHYVTLRSLVDDHKVTLPYIPELQERVQRHLQGIDSNLDDLGDYE